MTNRIKKDRINTTEQKKRDDIMLDIDINFLNFLLNPTYEYIKNDIEIIKENIIKDIKFEKQKDIKDRLNKIDFLFLTRVSNLRDFLCLLDDLLIKDIYQKLGEILGLSLSDNIKNNNNNFITNILINNNINYLQDDINLNILNTSILDYLINIKETTSNEKHKLLATNAINYIIDTTKKYDEIIEIVKPYYDLVAYKMNKQTEIIEKYQKQFIKKYSFLLSPQKQKIVKTRENYNISNLLKYETTFNDFFIFNEYFFLYNEYISLNDIIKIKKISKNPKIITELSKDIIKYNKLIKEELEEYEFTISKNEIKKYLISKLEETQENKKWIKELADFITEYIYNNSTNFFQGYLRTITLEPLTTILQFKDNNKLSNSFYHLICHELYHAKDFSLATFKKENYNPLLYEDNYKMLYEVYTEYRAINKIVNLISNKYFYKEEFIGNIPNTNYTELFFMLIDFFEEYKKEFEEAINYNNINNLEKTLGKRNFNYIINLINEFNNKKFNKDINYTKDIIKTFNKYYNKIQTRKKIKKSLTHPLFKRTYPSNDKTRIYSNTKFKK